MSFSIKLNDNNILTGSPTMIDICDINQCVSGNTGRMFPVNGYSSPININTIYNNLVQGGYSENSIVLNTATLNDCINNPTGTNRQLLDASFGWLFGSVETGGVAFRRIAGNTQAITKIELRLGANGDYTGGSISATNIATTVGVGSGSNADNNFYYFDNWYYNGIYQTEYTWTLGGPINIEYVDISIDPNPLYEVIAENVITNATSYNGAVLIENGIRRCPNIYSWGSGGRTGNENMTFFKAGFEYTPDPNGDDNEGQPEGGDGTPTASVPIDFPDLPPDDVLLSGIVKMFSPTTTELATFYNYIYSAPQNIIDNFKKIWTNPMDSIISLTTVPFFINTGARENIHFCGVDSEISCAQVAGQFQTIDCGKIIVEEEYKSFLEFEPFTTVKLFLPFVGFIDMKPSETVGATIYIKYNVDLLTGECIAFVKCVKSVNAWNLNINSVLYSFKGNVISSYPLTGNNWSGLYSGVAQTIAGIGSIASGNVGGGISSMANGIMQPMVSTTRSGAISGNSGTLGEYTPYLIFEKPIKSVPLKNQYYMGYPSNLGKDELEKYHDYTEVDTSTLKFNVSANYATAEEIDEIKQLLEGGVILP